jgi:hypothetical protein
LCLVAGWEDKNHSSDIECNGEDKKTPAPMGEFSLSEWIVCFDAYLIQSAAISVHFQIPPKVVVEPQFGDIYQPNEKAIIKFVEQDP